LLRKKTDEQRGQNDSADCRPVPTGDAQRKSPHDIGISSLHLQFAERFPSAPRGGKIARTGHFGQLGDPAQNRSPKSVCVPTRNASQFSSHEKFVETLCLFPFVGTHAFCFFSQENFFTAIENKIDFFLVDFATDF
jgi:hypothetical protein